MPLEELRRWTAKRICLEQPRVEGARLVKDDAAKVLRVFIRWKPGTTMFQLGIPRQQLERDLGRWVWDGWTVEVKTEGF